MTRVVPILLYHRVSDRPDDRFAVTPEQFAGHVTAIVASGRTPLTISEVAGALRGEAALPERPVAITFDDGYLDTPEAIDRLREVGLRATLYVTTGAVGQGDAISIPQLGALAQMRSIVELGAHTVNHPRLDELSQARARREIVESKRALEAVTGQRIETFAYPHGAYDQRTRVLVSEAGFRSAAAVKNALAHDADDPWAIARWTVTSSTTAEQIRRVLDGGGAPLAWNRERIRTRAFRAVRRARRELRTATEQNMASVEAGLSSAPVVCASQTPIAIVSADLTQPLVDVPVGSPRAGGTYRHAAVLARSGAQPLGWATIEVSPDGVIEADALARVLAGSSAAVSGDGGPPDVHMGDDQALLSVVITTCASPEATVDCVTRLLTHAAGACEAIVVDNRPAGSPVPEALKAAFAGDPAVRYVEEPAPGLSHARNAGLRAARGVYVAFIDDDVAVDEHWMAALRSTFEAHPHITCVTGPILPLELETPAQVLIEQFATFSKGLVSRTHNLASGSEETPLFPYAAGEFGSGANMAFRVEALRRLGGFDVALGAGTAARGGEDLDIAVRIILSGQTIAYEPCAIVWHRHPDTPERLRSQAFNYGVGLGAMLGKHLLVGPARLRLLALIPAGLRYLLHKESRKNAAKSADFPATLSARERLGMLFGPVAYLASRRQARRARAARPDRSHAGPEVRHVWSGELEVTEANGQPAVLTASGQPLQGRLLTTSGEPFDHARVLIRSHHDPIGFVQVPVRDGALDPGTVRSQARRQFGRALERPRAESAPAIGDSLVSVVLCTRNRAEGVRRCLEGLTAVDYPNTEYIVVDNAPSDNATAGVVHALSVHDARIRYVREARPGLSRARNRGVAEARGRFIAFTDDDVRVCRRWVHGLLQGFAERPDVACVTGLVASASLEHPVERFFDERVWWSSSCDQRLYDARTSTKSSLYPYAAGVFGTGANMAFRAEVLRALGGFDETLGAGAPTGGGEDLDIYVRVLLAGYALNYEPSALVWHDHRVDLAELEKQMYCYGKGLSAYICKYLLSRRTSLSVASRIAVGAWHFIALGRRSQSASARAGLGPELRRAELRGVLAGPGAYLRARRQQTRAHRKAVAP